MESAEETKKTNAALKTSQARLAAAMKSDPGAGWTSELSQTLIIHRRDNGAGATWPVLLTTSQFRPTQ